MIEYRKIYWGIGLMVVVFVGLLMLPKVGKFLINATPLAAEISTSTIPTITAIDPNYGQTLTEVTLSGNFETTGNKVNFGNFEEYALNRVTSSDGHTLVFNIPDSIDYNCYHSNPPCETETQLIPDGTYNITVSNTHGISNAVGFTVTSSTTPVTYTGPVYLCEGNQNCIQGFKMPYGSIADDQRVSLDDGATATSTSFAFDRLASGLHTLSVTSPADWYVGYTVCINSIDCHSDMPIQGDAVTINFRTTRTGAPSVNNNVVSVPAGSYVDIYWHFSQNFDDFASAPNDLNSNIDPNNPPTGTTPSGTTSGSAQADAYTGGNVNSGIGAGLAAAAKNALGCAISSIITPAIRSAVSSGVNIITGNISKPTTVPVTSKPQPAGGDNFDINREHNVLTAIVHSGTPGPGGLKGPALDALAYCLQNAMIKYIQQSALQWANTAFNGNPVFVQNLGQFIGGIGNQTALYFFNQLRGQNPNSPFQNSLNQSSVQSLNSNYFDQSNYNLNQSMPGGADKAFVNGNFYAGSALANGAAAGANNIPGNGNGSGSIAGGAAQAGSNWANWLKLTQDPRNNPYTQTLIREAFTNEKIATNEAYVAQTTAANGNYLGTPAQGSGNTNPAGGVGPGGGRNAPNPAATKVSVPGSTVGAMTNGRSQLADQRAVLAKGLNDVITQFINQLIQVALNKLFTAIK